MDLGHRAWVYRLFDEAGTLLYVGVTKDVSRRFVEHRCERPWWFMVRSTTIQRFDDQAAAEVAEREAIETEGPIYNISHSVDEDWAVDWDFCPVMAAPMQRRRCASAREARDWQHRLRGQGIRSALRRMPRVAR